MKKLPFKVGPKQHSLIDTLAGEGHHRTHRRFQRPQTGVQVLHLRHGVSSLGIQLGVILGNAQKSVGSLADGWADIIFVEWRS